MPCKRRVRQPLLSLLFVLGCASSPPPQPQPPTPPAAQAPSPPGDPDAPRYKPSASSPAAIDITTNAYGAYAAAPDAPEIGQTVQDFTVPLADGGTFDLAQARAAGPVLVMFYRGHW